MTKECARHPTECLTYVVAGAWAKRMAGTDHPGLPKLAPLGICEGRPRSGYSAGCASPDVGNARNRKRWQAGDVIARQLAEGTEQSALNALCPSVAKPTTRGVKKPMSSKNGGTIAEVLKLVAENSAILRELRMRVKNMEAALPRPGEVVGLHEEVRELRSSLAGLEARVEGLEAR